MTIHVNNFLSWHRISAVYVNDSGTWQRVRQIWVNNSGTWQQVFADGLEATLVAGSTGGETLIGYRTIGSMGSLTPKVFEDGANVDALYWDVTDFISLDISGFSSNPGQSYIASVSISGFGSLPTASALYSYGSGVASWQWVGAGQPFVTGQPYTITMER